MAKNIKVFENSAVLDEAHSTYLNARLLDRINELYGDNVPDAAVARLNREAVLLKNDCAGHLFFLLAQLGGRPEQESALRRHMLHRSSICASYTAWLLGITDINPLPPHYICSSCGHTEFDVPTNVKIAIDLPKRFCPVCGKKMHDDGFGLSEELYFELGDETQRSVQVDVTDVQKALRTLEGALPEVCRCLDSIGYAPDSAELSRLLAGTKRRLLFVPCSDRIDRYTPISKVGGLRLSEGPGWSIDGPVSGILVSDSPLLHRIEALEKLTGIPVCDIPFDDDDVLQKLIAVIEKGTNIGFGDFEENDDYGFAELFEVCAPKTFDDLVRISSIAHGTGVKEAVMPLLSNGAKLSEIIVDSDELYEKLRTFTDTETALRLKKRIKNGRAPAEVEHALLEENGIPSYLLNESIKYLPPRSFVIQRVKLALSMAYYASHYPDEYKAVISQ